MHQGGTFDGSLDSLRRAAGTRREVGPDHPYRRAAVLIEVDGWLLLTDPTFDASGPRYTLGWGSSSRKGAVHPLPRRGGCIDAVLLSHIHHADNLDDARRAL